MLILGINVYHADTAACIISDGKIIAACEEERFTRIKHFTGFPVNSINFCLNKAGIKINDIDYVTVNYNFNYNFISRLKFAFSNLTSMSLISKIISLINKKTIYTSIANNYGVDFKDKIIFVPHHISHISSSFLSSGFDNAVGLSIDATGDFSSMEISTYKNNKITVLEKNLYPHSLGILYQAISQFLGFKNYGDEYKVMALAAFGEAKYKNEFDQIIEFIPPFNFRLNLEYFIHHKQLIFENSSMNKPMFENLYSIKLEKLLGTSRKYNSEIEKRHYDIAASLQNKFEEIILKIIKNIYLENHSDNLCLSGGCIFNSVLNGKIYKNFDFENVFFHANVGDAGGAIGSALNHNHLINKNFKNIKQENYFLGPDYSNDDIKITIEKNKESLRNFEINFYENFDKIYELVSEILDKKGIVAWYQDESEWGPRALGNRSLIVDPRIKNLKEILNEKIKLREPFRPFAGSIMEEHTYKYFEVKNENDKFPNMNVVLQAKEKTKLNFPAIVHVDGSSRIQTLNKVNNKKFYNLVNTFNEKYSCPMVLNTSLNIDEPICESPQDVINSFAQTKVDCIVMQNYFLLKKV